MLLNLCPSSMTINLTAMSPTQNKKLTTQNGVDDAAEHGRDSTRYQFSESDVDTDVAELKNLDKVAATRVPLPRRCKGGLPFVVPPQNKLDKAKPEKQRKPAPKRRREKGNIMCAHIDIIDLGILFYMLFTVC